jgi:hypothetical protein
MLRSSAQFQRQRQTLLAGTATELLAEMGSRIGAVQRALAQHDESVLDAMRVALPLLRSAIDQLAAGALDASSLARLSAAVRALPDTATAS